MICSVFRPGYKKGKKKLRQRLYWGQYKIDGQIKVTRIPLKTPDKQVAMERLRKVVVDQQKVSVGLAASPTLTHATTKPLDQYIDQYVKDLEGRGNAERYIYCVEHRLATLQKECGWNTASDISALSFERWRNDKATSAKTRNDYLQAARGFVRWMVDHDFMASDPLSKVGKVKSNGTFAHERRALTDDEIVRLLAVADWRRPLYITAIFSGLRRGELEALTWGDVHLEETPPYVVARASTSKNRREARLPLHPDVVASLRAVKPVSCDLASKVFPPMYRMWHFKGDLKKAGIEYCDSQGRYADFHSLRHTFNTNLARVGVGERVRMAMMRHSDMKLTSVRYTDATQLPMVEGVNRLPSFTTPPVQNPAQPVQGPVHASGVLGPSQSLAVQGGETVMMQEHAENKGDSHNKSAGVDKGQNLMIGSAGPCLKRTTLFRRPSWRSPFQDGGPSPISFIPSSVPARILSSL